MKQRRYLTPNFVRRRLKRGDVLKLAYDDFNAGTFSYTHDHWCTARGRIECTGTTDYGDGESFEGVLYEYAGPHRTAPVMKSIMCRGSGAERVFLAPD